MSTIFLFIHPLPQITILGPNRIQLTGCIPKVTITTEGE